MKTLSVALATYNEEQNLARCLDTVRDFADEIVIVDGTSKDRTVAIAKEYKAKVIVRENPKIFHINKQIAIDNCSSDWILQLDADEHVSESLKQEIKEILREEKEFNGYWIPRKNYFLGRFLMKGGQYPDYTVRFYKKGKGRLPQKDVHEQAEIDGKIGYLKNPLLHYPYKDFKFYMMKWNRYNNIIAMQLGQELKSKKLLAKAFLIFVYLLIKPIYWFLLTYIRHKGFVDSWQGFVFCLFSALRFPFACLKYLKLIR